MKKIIFGAVAAMISLAACDTIQPVENPADKPYGGVSVGTPAVGGQSEADSIVFTASLGVQSKTYLDYNGYSYDLLWDENDQILIWDAGSLNGASSPAYEFSSIRSGAGTTTAEFAGTMQADSYVALYASGYDYPIDGRPVIHIEPSQHLQIRNQEGNLGTYTYPMVAVSNDRNFEFQNLCSILKVSITGNGELLKYVTVSAANGEPMAGLAMVHGSGNDFSLEFVGETEDDGVYSWVDYECGVVLSEDPVDCYIVIPAQTYSGGFDITVLTDCGYMNVSSGKSVTTQRSKFYDISIDYEPKSISYLLGDYTITADCYWDGLRSWTLSINESHDDTRTVWFLNLADGFQYQETRYYGIVSEDETVITIPFWQCTEYLYDNESPIYLCGFDGDESLYDEGSLEVRILRDGDDITLDFGNEWGLGFYVSYTEGSGCLEILRPGIVAVKNQQ